MITRDTLKDWHWHAVLMGDGQDKGGKFYIQEHTCPEEPRLTRSVRGYHHGRGEPVIVIRVDGAECADIDEAIKRLNQSPPTGESTMTQPQDNQQPTGSVVPFDPAPKALQSLHTAQVNAIVPQTFDEVYRFSQAISQSGLTPEGMRTPQQVSVAILTGLELGIKPMQAIQGIAVINGRPSVWGDLALAVVRATGQLEYIKESYEGTPPKNWTKPEGQELQYKAVCIVKRRGEPEEVRSEYSIEDATIARLWGKTSQSGKPTPWVTNPKRMLKMRARGFNLRDVFTDALKGVMIAEEMIGDDETEYRVVNEPPPAPPAAPKGAEPASSVSASGAGEPLTPPATDSPASPLTTAETGDPTTGDGAEDATFTEVAETPEQRLATLNEALSFCTTPEAVEEGYAATDLEAELAEVEGAVDKARAIKDEHLKRVLVATKVDDPFEIPTEFKDSEAYRQWVLVMIQSTTDRERAEKLKAAWNGSHKMGAKVCTGLTMTELKNAVATLVQKHIPKDPKKPASEKGPGKPTDGPAEAAAPEQSTAPEEGYKPSDEPRTPEEYTIWLDNLLATSTDSGEVTKAWFAYSDLKDSLTPPPTQAQRAEWKAKKDKRCAELRGDM